jgi:hypothetical protein
MLKKTFPGFFQLASQKARKLSESTDKNAQP